MNAVRALEILNKKSLLYYDNRTSNDLHLDRKYLLRYAYKDSNNFHDNFVVLLQDEEDRRKGVDACNEVSDDRDVDELEDFGIFALSMGPYYGESIRYVAIRTLLDDKQNQYALVFRAPRIKKKPFGSIESVIDRQYAHQSTPLFKLEREKELYLTATRFNFEEAKRCGRIPNIDFVKIERDGC